MESEMKRCRRQHGVTGTETPTHIAGGDHSWRPRLAICVGDGDGRYLVAGGHFGQ